MFSSKRKSMCLYDRYRVKTGMVSLQKGREEGRVTHWIVTVSCWHSHCEEMSCPDLIFCIYRAGL